MLSQGNNKACIRLKESKTDPFRCGISIPLFATFSDICPGENIRMILQLRQKFKAVPTDALFVLRDGTPVSRYMFLSRLDTILTRLGLDCTLYNGHSFRIGAATSAAYVCMEEHLIRT